MRRVVVFGTTGSGKSWLAEKLAVRHGLRIVELDGLYWGRDWEPAPLELFRHRVERELRDGDWIVVGNYDQVRDLTWRAADTLIWFDLPFPLVMWRLLRRTIRRVRSGEELWGTGNRETFRNSFFSRQSILLWAIRTHGRNHRRFAAEIGRLGPGQTVVHLHDKEAVERFVATSTQTPSPSAGEVAR